MNINDEVNLEKYIKLDLNPFCIDNGDIHFYSDDRFIIGILDNRVKCLIEFSYLSNIKINSIFGYNFSIVLFLVVQLLNFGKTLEFFNVTQSTEIQELLEYLVDNYSEFIEVNYIFNIIKITGKKKINFFSEECIHELTYFFPYKTNLFTLIIFGEKDNLPIFCINNKMSAFSENDNFVIELTENPIVQDPENCKIPKSELEKIFKWIRLNYLTILSFWKSQGYDDENNEYENISSRKILEGIKSI